MAEIKNLIDLLFMVVENFGDREGFAYKKDGAWLPVSYREFKKKVDLFAAGLLELGFRKGDKVGLLSENRIEWPIADFGAISIGVVDVPVYPTNTPPKVQYLLEDSQSRGVICSTENQLKKILEIRENLPELSQVICMDLAEARPGVLSFEDVLKKGEENWEKRKTEVEDLRSQIQEDDLVTLIYTSGTTGDPKGVMLTHKNFVSNVRAAGEVLPVVKEEVALSFLPLSHSFERCPGYYCMLYLGVKIAYAESIDRVPQNMVEVKPTVMCSVPRLYEKMYTRIMASVQQSPFWKRFLFFWALRSGETCRMPLYEGKKPGLWSSLKYKIADSLVFSKIRAKLGGKIRYFISGGAPLSPEIMKFFYLAGVLILEGYGLSETSPMISANTPDAFRFGTVGKPLPEVEVKIDEDGEILARGPNIMKGYFKKEADTRESIDEDGWFHTGDIGVWEEGFLKITDRKKDLIITAGGKNVAPGYLENLFKEDSFIEEFVVVGDRKKYIAALIVPHFESLKSYGLEKGLPFKEPEDLCDSPEIQKMIEARIQALSTNLASYETIKKFTLLREPFSEKTGELTPTMKVKRKVVYQKYSQAIDQMYPEE